MIEKLLADIEARVSEDKDLRLQLLIATQSGIIAAYDGDGDKGLASRVDGERAFEFEFASSSSQIANAVKQSDLSGEFSDDLRGIIAGRRGLIAEYPGSRYTYIPVGSWAQLFAGESIEFSEHGLADFLGRYLGRQPSVRHALHSIVEAENIDEYRIRQDPMIWLIDRQP